MRRPVLLSASILFAWLTLLCIADAQCGDIPSDYNDVVCEYETCPSELCGPGGNPSEFCNLGYGLCCNEIPYTTANTHYDSYCACHSQCGCDSPTENPAVYRPGLPPDNRCTPLLIDVSGKGFHLTDALHGVLFDMFVTGYPVAVPWPASGADNG